MGLNGFRKQTRNANKHTEKGLRELEHSIQRDGWIGAITTAADGETFDGSARLDTLANVMPNVEPIVVETDGQTPVIIKRTDIPNADDPKAKRLAVGANVIHRLDFEPDIDLLAELAGEDPAIADLLKQDGGISAMILQGDVVNDPLAEWKGMPEFEQGDSGAFKSITVHFDSLDNVKNFSELVGQIVTDKTKFIWYPKKEKREVKAITYSDES